MTEMFAATLGRVRALPGVVHRPVDAINAHTFSP
jgi:hypothetical protein